MKALKILHTLHIAQLQQQIDIKKKIKEKKEKLFAYLIFYLKFTLVFANLHSE